VTALRCPRAAFRAPVSEIEDSLPRLVIATNSLPRLVSKPWHPRVHWLTLPTNPNAPAECWAQS
jgi:hypothetical protein